MRHLFGGYSPDKDKVPKGKPKPPQGGTGAVELNSSNCDDLVELIVRPMVEEWDRYLKYNRENKFKLYGYGAMECAVSDARKLIG